MQDRDSLRLVLELCCEILRRDSVILQQQRRVLTTTVMQQQQSSDKRTELAAPGKGPAGLQAAADREGDGTEPAVDMTAQRRDQQQRWSPRRRQLLGRGPCPASGSGADGPGNGCRGRAACGLCGRDHGWRQPRTHHVTPPVGVLPGGEAAASFSAGPRPGKAQAATTAPQEAPVATPSSRLVESRWAGGLQFGASNTSPNWWGHRCDQIVPPTVLRVERSHSTAQGVAT